MIDAIDRETALHAHGSCAVVVFDDGPDFEFVGHFTGLANSLGQSVRVIITTRLTPRKTPAAVALLIASRA